MGLTGKFKFRKTLWGKIVLQIEEEVKPFWSRSNPEARKRRWRDAALMDLAAPEMAHAHRHALQTASPVSEQLCARGDDQSP